jgi:hypothetical protein
MTLSSLLIIIIATFIVLMIIFILGRLKVKAHYLGLISCIAIFTVILIALYVNDSNISLFSFLLSGFISIFCGLSIFLAFKLVDKIKQ